MLLVLTGVFLLALGLFSGAVLVAAPLGLAPWSAGATLWALFPTFAIAGYVLLVVGGRSGTLRTASVLLSALLIVLALAAAAGLVMQAAGVVQPVGSTLALWYVMAIAGSLGVLGAAASGRPASGAQGGA